MSPFEGPFSPRPPTWDQQRKTEFRMQGVRVDGELYIREADCRRAVNDALKTGKEALIKSHDNLLDALTALVRDTDGHAGSFITRDLARKAIAEAKRAG